MISYEKFWITLKEKGITQYELINKHGISAGQLSRMRKNSYISTHTVDILCTILDCNVEDIMSFHKDTNEFE